MNEYLQQNVFEIKNIDTFVTCGVTCLECFKSDIVTRSIRSLIGDIPCPECNEKALVSNGNFFKRGFFIDWETELRDLYRLNCNLMIEEYLKVLNDLFKTCKLSIFPIVNEADLKIIRELKTKKAYEILKILVSGLRSFAVFKDLRSIFPMCVRYNNDCVGCDYNLRRSGRCFIDESNGNEKVIEAIKCHIDFLISVLI